jgi:hypothetical protein
MGTIRSVGWHNQQVFYLMFEEDTDAAHFRLVFDIPIIKVII